MMKTRRWRGLMMLPAVALCLSVAACSVLPSDNPPVPDSTMVHVLVDLHLRKARAQITDRQPELPPADTSRAAVLQHYGLTNERFQKAMDYYTHHPEAFSALYDDVLNRLDAERSGTSE